MRLESWKEIAAYLQRDVRTAHRWEKEEGLPVHRHSHKSRSSVYAYPSEIDAWRAGRRVTAEPAAAPARPWWRPLWAMVAAALCLVMVGSGMRSAEAASNPGHPSARQVWAGTDVDTSGKISADGRYLSFADGPTGDLAIRDLRTGKNRRLTDDGWWKSGDHAEISVMSPDGSQVAYYWWINKESRGELRLLALKGAQAKEPRTLSRDMHTGPVAWTSDGRRLLVLRASPNSPVQLGTVTLEDGSFRVVKSAPGPIVRPTISLDGRWVAYGLPPDPEHNVPAGIYVMSTDGGREINVVLNDSRPLAWSPDGSRLLFLSDRTGSFSMWSIGVASGKAVGQAEMVRPGLIDSLGMTRSGTFYYQVRGANRSNIYSAEIGPGGTISNPALAGERFVNSNAGASISPDGKTLAYYMVRMGGQHKVILKSIETGKERDFEQDQPLLAPALLGPMWFPDNRSLLIGTYNFSKPGCAFYRLNVATGEKELVLSLSTAPVGFRLSPDGKSLFYRESNMEGAFRLMRYDLDSRRGTQISAPDRIEPEIAISPDGKQIAYGVQTEVATIRYLAVMPVTGGPGKELIRGPRICTYNCLGWSADGKFLLYTRGSENPKGSPSLLWRIPATGGTPEQTGLSQPGLVRGPRMTSDGRRLFYTVSEPDNNEVWALENFLSPAKGGK